MRTVLISIVIFCTAIVVSGQTALDNPITHSNDQFIFMGKNNIAGTGISELKACIATGSPRTPMARVFEIWITDISEVSALKMFNMKRCDLVGFQLEDKPGRKWRTVNSFEEYAAGKSMYKVESNELVLVKSFAGEIYYIVVAARSTSYKLGELDVCGPPPIIDRYFKSRKRSQSDVSSSYCHNLQQQIDKVKSPTKYVAHMKRTSSVLFSKEDFEAQKKKGLFKGKAIYTFDGGDEIVPLDK